ncbi:hypothetical protein N7465_000740 [Penicillium sp. CMV-2018d]|nr:hypothetical protein N7465_000740 [Penicillium sp. CMV-2018d]
MAWTRSRYGRTDQGHMHKDTDYRESWQPVQRNTNTVGTEVLPPVLWQFSSCCGNSVQNSDEIELESLRLLEENRPAWTL